MATYQRQEFIAIAAINAQRCVQVRTNGIVYGIGGRALAARWLWSMGGCFLLACGEGTGIQSPHLIHLLQIFTAEQGPALWRNNQKSFNFWRIKVQRAIIILVHTLYNRKCGRYFGRTGVSTLRKCQKTPSHETQICAFSCRRYGRTPVAGPMP